MRPWLDPCTFPKNELLLRLYPERRRITSWLVNLGGPADIGAIRAFFVANAVHERIWTSRGDRTRVRRGVTNLGGRLGNDRRPSTGTLLAVIDLVSGANSARVNPRRRAPR